MKLFKYLLVIMGIVSVASCNNNDDDDIIWEPYPHFVRVDIVDEQGNDLMSDNYAGIIEKDNLESQITCIYEGETYPIQINPPYYGDTLGENKKQSRDINPQFHALFFEEYYDMIRFGDFDGGCDISGEFTICWPDGTSDTVAFKNTAHKMKSESSDEVSVNGGPWQKTFKVKFVK